MSRINNPAAPVDAPIVRNGGVTAPSTKPATGRIAGGSAPLARSSHPALSGDVINGAVIDVSAVAQRVNPAR